MCNITDKKAEIQPLIEQLVEQYNKNIETQAQIKERIIELQGAIKVLNELEQENVDTDTDSETP